MTLLVGRAQTLAAQRDAGIMAEKLFSRGTDGGRIIGLALARVDPQRQHIDLAFSSIGERRSAFEQYQALLLTEALLPLLDATTATQLWSAISSELGATIREDDQDRWAVAQRLIEKLDAMADRQAPSQSKSRKPIIYISYAHADEPERPRGGEVQWLSFVMKFLRPALKSGEFAISLDRLVPSGTNWDDEIERNLRTCDVFVLLVSANSMASSYVVDREIAIVRERHRNGEFVHFYPLLVEPTPRAGLDNVRDFNLRPRDAKPLSGYSLHDRDQIMADVADEIAAIAAEVAARKGAAKPSKTTERAPAFVQINGLPETFYERLVGRAAEFERLDQAWSDKKTNILSLVADGGAGKSALVNEWLTRLQGDGYRGADCVLGWSFFSQGSKERATAADAFLNWALARLGMKVESTSAAAKGEAIAESLIKRRALLVLDGVEPLQHGPGPQTGQLKDQGLRALLRRFAAAPPRGGHSLIVLTSRLAVTDIQRFRTSAAPVVDVDKLSDEAGAELLRDNDVWGVDRDLKAASRDFGGHPLTLTLLASLIKETQNGDVRRRDHIRGLLADVDNPPHDRRGARRNPTSANGSPDTRCCSPSSIASACSIGPRAATASRLCARSLSFPD